MAYASLEQRMAQTYIDTFPPFIPDGHAEVSVSEQERFYILMQGLYRLAFDEPLLFVPSLHEDDAYPNRFTKSSYGKPDLQVNMNKFTNTLNALLQNMFLMGQGSDIKLNKRQQAILDRLGIGGSANLPAAWTWLANRPGANTVIFSRCLFKEDYPYTSDIYARLLGEAGFRKLESWMTERGYKSFDFYEVTASDCKLSLTYANPAWGKDRPNGGFEYKIRHTGISARYDPERQNPAVLGLCIPNGLKTFLEASESMGGNLRGFIISHTKKCDNCRYCVQTDKTGSRPFACIPVGHEGKIYNLCPYFPGSGFCWNSIDDGLAERLIEMLSFMDGFAP